MGDLGDGSSSSSCEIQAPAVVVRNFNEQNSCIFHLSNKGNNNENCDRNDEKIPLFTVHYSVTNDVEMNSSSTTAFTV